MRTRTLAAKFSFDEGQAEATDAAEGFKIPYVHGEVAKASSANSGTTMLLALGCVVEKGCSLVEGCGTNNSSCGWRRKVV